MALTHYLENLLNFVMFQWVFPNLLHIFVSSLQENYELGDSIWKANADINPNLGVIAP